MAQPDTHALRSAIERLVHDARYWKTTSPSDWNIVFREIRAVDDYVSRSQTYQRELAAFQRARNDSATPNIGGD